MDLLNLHLQETEKHVKIESAKIEEYKKLSETKETRKFIITNGTLLNTYISERENSFMYLVCDVLKDFDYNITDELNLLKIKDLYVKLSANGGRICVRYKKLPGCWLSFGIYAGFLEDMVVVMRTSTRAQIWCHLDNMCGRTDSPR